MSRVVLATLNAKYVHSSLALRYLRAKVEDRYDVRLREFTIHDPAEQIVAGVYSDRPDVVGFSCYIWNIEETLRVISVLRKVLPDVFIVLGGPEVSFDSLFFLERAPQVDAIVEGEGEETFSELLDARFAGRDCKGIPGVAWRRGDGSVMRNGPRTRIRSLDGLPTPYPPHHLGELTNRVVYFEASRGCPFTCQFCLSSIESGVRYFSLERVKEDLTRLIALGVPQVKFVDRTFNLRRDYALELFRFLAEQPGQTSFHFEITADVLKPDVANWLCEHAPPGRFRFEIGVQSTNDLTNDLVRRRQDFARLSQTVRSIRNSGRILQHLDLIAGLPEEDYASFRRTFNDVFALRPDELQLGFLKMLRGTGLRSSAAEFGYEFMDTAPYEILRNRVLSYDDLLRLKNLEDVLEKYYNSGRFSNTVAYLAEEVYPSAFDFFEAFGAYWNLRGWSRIGHQPLDLIRRLQEFLSNEGLEDETAQGLLRADYLLREKFRPRAFWWDAGRQRDLVRDLLRSVSRGVVSVEPPLADEELRRPGFEKRVVADRIAREAAVRLGFRGPGEDSGDAILLYVFPANPATPSTHRIVRYSREVLSQC